ncbi:hypothetical protein EVAR_33550_1 [Eumeta japonica]|uniref:Uncharacterized protein n=1 Tax=Eumeta variegata TaxID=151549 RepID=A0A4C1VJP0_EUMVA|nr:hypothetical protein EVAR_33550_1 [Eumeta japonica]
MVLFITGRKRKEVTGTRLCRLDASPPESRLSRRIDHGLGTRALHEDPAWPNSSVTMGALVTSGTDDLTWSPRHRATGLARISSGPGSHDAHRALSDTRDGTLMSSRTPASALPTVSAGTNVTHFSEAVLHSNLVDLFKAQAVRRKTEVLFTDVHLRHTMFFNAWPIANFDDAM